MFRIPARGRHVTPEPLAVADQLLGAPLATFRRRAVAYVIDLAVFGLVVGSLFLGLSAWSIHRDDPTLLTRLGSAMTGSLEPGSPANTSVTMDIFRLVARRAPGVLPAAVEEPAVQGDSAAIDALMNDRDLTLSFGSGPTRLDRSSDPWLLKLGTDVLLGSFSTFFSWGAFFVGWFTILVRITRGRSLGKALMRIRIVRLDGKPLSWWNAFSRAGGYSASAATAMLGFLEMIWDPNRQTLHDKIAATVVVDAKRRDRSDSR